MPNLYVNVKYKSAIAFALTIPIVDRRIAQTSSYMIAYLFWLAVAGVPSDVDILAQIRRGNLLCVNPDMPSKTCSSTAAYAVSADGSVIETSEVLLSPDQPLTLEMSVNAEIEKGTSCGVMTMADLQKAQVRMNGEVLQPDRHAIVLKKLSEKLAPMAGQRACDALRIEEGRLVKYGQVDKIDIKLPGKPVIWITATDEFKVAPRKSR